MTSSPARTEGKQSRPDDNNPGGILTPEAKAYMDTLQFDQMIWLNKLEEAMQKRTKVASRTDDNFTS